VLSVKEGNIVQIMGWKRQTETASKDTIAYLELSTRMGHWAFLEATPGFVQLVIIARQGPRSQFHAHQERSLLTQATSIDHHANSVSLESIVHSQANPRQPWTVQQVSTVQTDRRQELHWMALQEMCAQWDITVHGDLQLHFLVLREPTQTSSNKVHAKLVQEDTIVKMPLPTL